jgi:hypothetical protein
MPQFRVLRHLEATQNENNVQIIVKVFKNGLKRLKNEFFKMGCFGRKLGYPQKLCVTDGLTTLQALFYKGLVDMLKK